MPLKLSASAMVPREVNYLTKFFSVSSVIKMFQSRACSANTRFYRWCAAETGSSETGTFGKPITVGAGDEL
jgi:hypothetical protein